RRLRRLREKSWRGESWMAWGLGDRGLGLEKLRQRALERSGSSLRTPVYSLLLACTFLTIVASTAMRTATPLVTCRWMTDWGPSATSLEISTSRFIGPGCI